MLKRRSPFGILRVMRLVDLRAEKVVSSKIGRFPIPPGGEEIRRLESRDPGHLPMSRGKFLISGGIGFGAWQVKEQSFDRAGGLPEGIVDQMGRLGELPQLVDIRERYMASLDLHAVRLDLP